MLLAHPAPYTPPPLVAHVETKSVAASPDDTYCSCVATAIMQGVPLPMIDAKDIPANSVPHVGAAILMTYPDKDHPGQMIGHVGTILALGNDIFAVEGNFKKCAKTTRHIAWDDPHIRGFWSPQQPLTLSTPNP